MTVLELMFVAVDKHNLDLVKLCVEKGANLNYQHAGKNILEEALSCSLRTRMVGSPQSSIAIIDYLLSLNLRANWVKNDYINKFIDSEYRESC